MPYESAEAADSETLSGARVRRRAAADGRKAKAKRSRKNGALASDQLIEATSELLVERGTTDVSLSDIAERSGVNSALVKYYFGNKAGLYFALLKKRLGPGVVQLEHILNSDLTSEEKLRIHISGHVKTYMLFPYVNRLIHELTATDPEYGIRIVEEISKPVALIQRKILEEGIANGVFRDIDPLHFYFHLIGASDQIFHGRYQMKYIFGRDGVDEDMKRGYIEHLYTMMTRGLLTNPG